MFQHFSLQYGTMLGNNNIQDFQLYKCARQSFLLMFDLSCSVPFDKAKNKWNWFK